MEARTQIGSQEHRVGDKNTGNEAVAQGRAEVSNTWQELGAQDRKQKYRVGCRSQGNKCDKILSTKMLLLVPYSHDSVK